MCEWIVVNSCRKSSLVRIGVNVADEIQERCAQGCPTQPVKPPSLPRGTEVPKGDGG